MQMTIGRQFIKDARRITHRYCQSAPAPLFSCTSEFPQLLARRQSPASILLSAILLQHLIVTTASRSRDRLTNPRYPGLSVFRKSITPQATVETVLRMKITPDLVCLLWTYFNPHVGLYHDRPPLWVLRQHTGDTSFDAVMEHLRSTASIRTIRLFTSGWPSDDLDILESELAAKCRHYKSVFDHAVFTPLIIYQQHII